MNHLMFSIQWNVLHQTDDPWKQLWLNIHHYCNKYKSRQLKRFKKMLWIMDCLLRNLSEKKHALFCSEADLTDLAVKEQFDLFIYIPLRSEWKVLICCSE